MNEHPNLALVNKFFKAYSSNSIDELQDIFHADVKWHIPGSDAFLTKALAFLAQ